jgi:hypothetical protein
MKGNRTFEIVQSIDVDFDTNQWRVHPLSSDYHVGAGLYLMVPIVDSQQGEDFKDLIASQANRGGVK